MLHPADLIGTAFDVDEGNFEVVLTKAGGWQGRRKVSGHRRSRLLTPPCETPDLAVESLRLLGYLTGTGL